PRQALPLRLRLLQRLRGVRAGVPVRRYLHGARGDLSEPGEALRHRPLGPMLKSCEAEMDSSRVTESEFQQSFGAVTEQARRTRVTIAKEGRDHVVVVSAEEFARLKRRDRQVGLAADLPEEWVEAVRQAKVPDEFSHLNSELD